MSLPSLGNTRKLEILLLEAKEIAEQEFFNLKIINNKLSDEEEELAECLETCLGYIREALSCLKTC